MRRVISASAWIPAFAGMTVMCDRRAGFGIGTEGIGAEGRKRVWHGGHLSLRITPANLPYFCLMAAITRLANSAVLPACQRHTTTRSCSGETTMSLLPAPSAA